MEVNQCVGRTAVTNRHRHAVDVEPRALDLGYSDSNPEFKHELEKCHSKQGGWPTDADFDFVYTFSYGAGSDRLVGFSCRHEGVTPFIPADAVRQLQQTRRLLSISH